MNRILLLMLLYALVAACATSPTGRSQLMLISPQAAVVESKKAYLSTVSELDKKNKLVNDPALAKRVATITGRLIGGVVVTRVRSTTLTFCLILLQGAALTTIALADGDWTVRLGGILFGGSVGNVLMLDEPSNDLDVETLRALEDALLEFAGSIMVISHDRWFLDRIATHILACEGDSQWTFFDGNYQEYEADKKKRLGEEGAKPKRMRYKALK